MVTKLRFGAFATLMLAAPIQADTTLHYTIQGECPAIAESVEVSGSLMRIDTHAQDQDYVSIFDGTEDVLTTVMPAQHQYNQVEIDEDALDDTAGAADGSDKQARDQMQKMQSMVQQCSELEARGGSCASPPDTHAVLQSVATVQPKTEMRDSGHKKSVSGIDCNVFEVLENGSKKREVCYAIVSELPIPADDREGLGRGLQVLTHYRPAFSGLAERLGATAGDASDAPEGFAMAQTCFDAAGQTLGQAAVDISQETIAVDRFDIPAGYTKMTMPENPAGN